MIPIDQIAVLNPRERNGRVFEEIVGNIKRIGLKKPITVTPRNGHLEDGKRYLLICGEGRLKAFKSLGEKEIPALVVEVNDEDAFIMSLTENIARANTAAGTAGEHRQLSEQGYDKKAIAQKTGLSLDYIKGILLLRKARSVCSLPSSPGGFRSMSPSPSRAQATKNPSRPPCRTPMKAASCAAGS
jgi:ParB family chromosome partitioning protein